MKKFINVFAAVLLTASVFAQAPQKISYQAVIRDASSVLITSTVVGMQISILQGSQTGTLVYLETQTPTTNVNGLVSIEIGGGIGFDTINWSNGPYFIKTETDPAGSTNYTISGTSQLLSVPYALHAKTAENISGTITENDPVYGSSVASGISGTDITNWNNKIDVEVDGSVTNEIQILSISNDTIYLSNGGFVKLPAGFDGQYSSLTGIPTNVSSFTNDAGYLTTFTEVDGSVTNELQALTISNDTVYLTNGGFVKLPAGFDGQYSSLTGAPTNVSSFTNDAGYLTTFTEVDGSVTNELQVITISNDTIYLSNGGFVKLPAGFNGDYNSLTNTPTNVSSFTNDAGYLTTFTEVDGSVTNELQVITISNDTVYLSDGGFVKLPAGFDGQYSSLSGAPTNVSSFTNDAGYLTTFTEVDGSVTNELQALSLSNDTIYLSNGGFVKLPINNWSLLGNTGTNPTTNFIGTKDANDLAFKTNNSEKMRISSSGKVGIGTSGTTFPLEVSVPSTNGSQFNLKLTNLTLGIGNGVGILFAPDDAAIAKMGIFVERKASWGFSTMHFLSRLTSDYASADLSNSVMSLTQNGNLGIGTTTPTAKFQIESQGLSREFLIGINSLLLKNQTANERTLFALAPNGSAQNADLLIYHNSDITTNYEYMDLGYDNSQNHFHIGIAKGGTGTIRRLVLDATGTGSNTWKQLVLATNSNVGIGVISPSTRLEVSGGLKVNGTITDKNIFLAGGFGSGIGGEINITSGYGTNARGGNVNISTGYTSSWAGAGESSDVFIRGGYMETIPSYASVQVGGGKSQVGGTNETAGGNLTLSGGNANLGNQNGGNVLILPGIASGTGTNGYVGIGTTIPSTALDVNGVITATGGNSTNWNDAFSWGNHSLAGYLTSEVDGSITNELQALSLSNDTVYLSDGGFVKIPEQKSVPALITQDDFSYTAPVKNYWTSYTTGGTGLSLSNSTATISTNFTASTGKLYSNKQKSVNEGKLIFTAVISTYEDGNTAYGPLVRGLVNGTDRNNAIEFINITGSVIQARTVSGGVATTTNYAVGASVYNFYSYTIIASTTKVEFYFDGTLIATHTTNIPTANLNMYFDVSSWAGNVVHIIDDAKFEIIKY